MQCRQARDICAALAQGPGGPPPVVGAPPATEAWKVAGNPTRLNNGNLDYVVEYDLGNSQPTLQTRTLEIANYFIIDRCQQRIGPRLCCSLRVVSDGNLGSCLWVRPK